MEKRVDSGLAKNCLAPSAPSNSPKCTGDKVVLRESVTLPNGRPSLETTFRAIQLSKVLTCLLWLGWRALDRQIVQLELGFRRVRSGLCNPPKQGGGGSDGQLEPKIIRGH